jgi:hypothetical protein
MPLFPEDGLAIQMLFPMTRKRLKTHFRTRQPASQYSMMEIGARAVT